MTSPRLHHASVCVVDLERSVAFYRDVLGLKQVPRPPFASVGAWFGLGATELHLVVNPGGTYRVAAIDSRDCHFALRVDDFEAMIRQLEAHGFRAEAAEDDPKRMVIIRAGRAGFPQAFVADPDRHIVEINASA